jgi:heparan-alpha-glucosaminide N-acetyltransferase
MRPKSGEFDHGTRSVPTTNWGTAMSQPVELSESQGALSALEQAESAAPQDEQTTFVKQRLRSLDAYRGLIMILLAFVGFGFFHVAENYLAEDPNSGFWSSVKYHFSHTQWVGCSLWDMIQPSFMFMVGVAMAFSYAKRKRLGHSYWRMLGHAVWRSILLILLGVFLSSNWSNETNWAFANVLSQIGLGYTFVFLLWGRPVWVQAIAAVVILVGTWLLFTCYMGAGIDIAQGAPDIGVEQAWAEEHLAGIPAAWHKNANIGHAVDVPLLNLFPRKEPFKFNKGGYHTINFIPSLATMLFGLMCGELLRSKQSAGRKLALLIVAGLVGLALGWVLDLTGVCPVVKRIWTPSWALFSTGWCCLILAALFAVIDVLQWRWWAFPLVVVGMNPIAMYFMFQLIRGWTANTLQIHLGLEKWGGDIFAICGKDWAPFVQATMVGICLWLICLWLYRKKIFIRV